MTTKNTKLRIKEFKVPSSFIIENLKDFLQSIGMTQIQLARLTGFSAKYINDVCHGRKAANFRLKSFLDVLQRKTQKEVSDDNWESLASIAK